MTLNYDFIQNKQLQKNCLYLFLLLDLIRPFISFSDGDDRYDQAELNMTIFVGLNILALYGVHTNQKPLLLIFIAVYSSRIPSRMVMFYLGRYFTAGDFLFLGYQIIILITAVHYAWTHAWGKGDSRNPSDPASTEDSDKLPKETSTWDPLHLEVSKFVNEKSTWDPLNLSKEFA